MNGVAKMPKVGMQPIRRRQLIDATLEAINEVGMHDATIAQIARRAGVSTGIISHYFKDKNGLLEATMRDITGQLRDAVLSRLRALPDGSAEQRLQAIVGGNFDETQVSGAAMCSTVCSRSAAVGCSQTWCTSSAASCRVNRLKRRATGWRR